MAVNREAKTMEKCYRKGSRDSWFTDKDVSIALIHTHTHIHYTKRMETTVKKKPKVIAQKKPNWWNRTVDVNVFVCISFLCTTALSRLDKAVEIRWRREAKAKRRKVGSMKNCYRTLPSTRVKSVKGFLCADIFRERKNVWRINRS